MFANFWTVCWLLVKNVLLLLLLSLSTADGQHRPTTGLLVFGAATVTVVLQVPDRSADQAALRRGVLQVVTKAAAAAVMPWWRLPG